MYIFVSHFMIFVFSFAMNFVDCHTAKDKNVDLYLLL